MINIPYSGGKRAGPRAVEQAGANLRAHMALGTDNGGNLMLDPLLQAVAGQLRHQFPECAAIE
jgi:hypothetical protein